MISQSCPSSSVFKLLPVLLTAVFTISCASSDKIQDSSQVKQTSEASEQSPVVQSSDQTPVSLTQQSTSATNAEAQTSEDNQRRGAQSGKSKAAWIAQKVPLKREANRYSAEQLNFASHLLRVANEEGDGDIAENNLFCSIRSNESTRLLQALKVRVDERLQRELQTPASRRLNPQFWSKVKSCERLCSCRYYVDVLEGVSDSVLKPKQRELKRQALKISESITLEKAKLCAGQAQWFCKSELLRELRTEAKEIFGPNDDENSKTAPNTMGRDQKN